jgi:O-antigen/teichoic acid export membrane protein
MPAVYGADFASAASIARLLLLEGAISGTVWVMLQAFLALGRPELSAALQVVALALLVSLLLVVVPRYGAAGAAGVLLAVAIVKFALAMALYRVVLGASARRFLPDPADLQYVWDRLHR